VGKAQPTKKIQKASAQGESLGEIARAARGSKISKSGRQHARGAHPEKKEEMSRSASATRKRAARHRKTPTKDPKGGLTAAGRRQFNRKQGAVLKPGVKKPSRSMTPEEMRRKGSWAVRFYGRKGKLPPLVDKDRRSTRFALTAAAWGEPVPKTVSAARKIAAKGRRLLERYTRFKRSEHETRPRER
jgi:Domain of unknown function (DUF6321)